MGIGRALWRRRTRRLEEERNRLEAAVDERTRELSLENARAEQQKREIERSDSDRALVLLHVRLDGYRGHHRNDVQK